MDEVEEAVHTSSSYQLLSKKNVVYHLPPCNPISENLWLLQQQHLPLSKMATVQSESLIQGMSRLGWKKTQWSMHNANSILQLVGWMFLLCFGSKTISRYNAVFLDSLSLASRLHHIYSAASFERLTACKLTSVPLLGRSIKLNKARKREHLGV